MRLLAQLRHLYRNAFRRNRLETDLDDELRNYVDALIARNTAAGMSVDEALRSALAEVGGIDQVKEGCREVRPLAVLDSVIGDLAYALRTLRKSPAFTATAVLSLALGIGASSTLFSGVNGLLLRTVAVSHPETLVRIRSAGRNDMANGINSYGDNGQNASREDIRETISYPIYQTLRSANQTLTDIAAGAPIRGDVNVMADGGAELASASEVSGNYFELLGVGARLGRTLMPDDDTDSQSAVATISYGYWQKRFGGSPAAIGRSLTINGVQVTVVGILSRDFTDIQSLTTPPRDIYVPLALDNRLGAFSWGGPTEPRLKEATDWWLQIVGRLKPGVTFEQVRANLEGSFEAAARSGLELFLASLSPKVRPVLDNGHRTAVPHLEVDSASRGIYDPGTDDVKAAQILSAVVILIMVIVCANVANLLLSKATARQREISVRMSLGATRLRVVRQLLTESLLLSSAGGVLGVLLGYWLRQLLPFASEAPMDWRVLTFTLALSVVAAVSFGLAPALRATRLNLSGSMKESGRSLTRSRTLLTRALVVLQVAISLAVLIGAGLFLRTVRNLRNAPPGFDTRNLIIFSINPSLGGHDPKHAGRLFDDLHARLSAIPGIRGVSHSFPDLLANQTIITGMHIQVIPGSNAAAAGAHKVWVLSASPEYMDTMGLRLIRGRGIEDRDTLPNGLSVCLINETVANTFFPGEDPIGQRWGRSPEHRDEIEIVGVFGDVKFDGLRDPAPPTVLEPFPHETLSFASFEIRTAGDPAGYMKAVRETVRSVAPSLPIVRMLTQSDIAEQGIQQERFFALAYSLFGALALLLASIGLFGVMSYSVASRTNEIGIRMSLGAQKHKVVRMVLSESLSMIAIGLAVGLGASFAAGRLIRSMLFGLAPTDSVTIVLAALTLSVVAVLAGYLPARRAAHIDPLVALRYE